MKIKVISAVCIAFIVLLLGIAVGSVYIPLLDILRIFAHVIFGAELPEHLPFNIAAIVWNVRTPRVLLAFFAGASLSVSGAVMQSVLRNPLASSYTLGVSSGASLGASLVIFLGVALPFAQMASLPILGFSFGLVTILLVMGISSKLDSRMNNHTIILTGIVFSLFVSAISTLMFAFFRESLQRMVFWQMGSFNIQDLNRWHVVLVLAPIAILGSFFVTRHKWELDVMTFGEEQAHTIGINTKTVKRVLLITAAAMTGGTIAFVGVIGFVDLVAPHIVRKIFGAAHKYVIPMSAVVGGTFMVVADLVARTFTSPIELPVGAVTAIIGAPFFAWVYFSKRKEKA